MAHPPGVAVGRIERVCAHNEGLEVPLEGAELANRSADLVGTGAQQLEDVRARHVAVVPQGDDAADLAQGQSDRLGAADEHETIEDVDVELAIAGRRATGRLDEPDVLVVPERLRRQPGAFGDLTNEHGLTFQCTGISTVSSVDIEILTVPECPHGGLALDRLREALEMTGTDAHVRHTSIETDEDALARGMFGSPTILIDGRDPFVSASTTPSLSCRLFRTDVGIEGAPTTSQLVAALTA